MKIALLLESYEHCGEPSIVKPKLLLHETGSLGLTSVGRMIWNLPPFGISANNLTKILIVFTWLIILFVERNASAMMSPGTVDLAISPDEIVAIKQVGQELIPGGDYTESSILKLSDDPIDFGLVNPLIAM